MNTTISYYNQNAQQFIESTAYIDFTSTQDRFLAMLQKGASILDFGCGAGRDTKYFCEKGFRVDAIDGSEELCKFAAEYSGVEVKHMYFQELSAVEAYDGIWACASILHLNMTELEDVLKKMAIAVKEDGIIYTSFKYGTRSEERNGRFFTDMTEKTWPQLLEKVSGLSTEELWVTTDVRPGRGEERWLNVILRKADIH